MGRINNAVKSLLVAAAIGILVGPVAWAAESTGTFLPRQLEPVLSSDGKSLLNGAPPVIMVHRPKPPHELRRVPPPVALVAQPETAASTFTITYVAEGGADLWGEYCYAFPEDAKPAFNAAAAIWANLLQSPVPITIRACWADLGSSSILGYSGGGTSVYNFSGAPLTDTIYSASLANSLYGSDLDPANADMHITYNRNFSWYYGTDGNPGAQMDLMTVVLHEIGHGLNFAGTAQYSGGQGRLGWGTGYPGTYDRFMRDGSGTALTAYPSYTSYTTALGTTLTGGDLWFHGSNAMAANGGNRVRMYAPGTWAGGSSYSHLDYTTFNNTANQLMVYAVSYGEAVHDPGAITLGMLKDMGWQLAGSDTTPDPFTFTDQTNVSVSTVITSNTITVSGISAAAPISITGGAYSVNGGPYTSGSGTVNNGSTVTVQVTSAGSYLATTNATLTIGGVSDTFSVTTGAGTPPIVDFNNDGKTDILWRLSTTGQLNVWYMDGIAMIGGDVIVDSVPLAWRVAGMGDFNNDGKIDILWRHTTLGHLSVWYMNGKTLLSADTVYLNVPLAWEVAGVGDFNADGKPDILWRHTTLGHLSVWYMNGKTLLGSAVIYLNVALSWEVAG